VCPRTRRRTRVGAPKALSAFVAQIARKMPSGPTAPPWPFVVSAIKIGPCPPASASTDTGAGWSANRAAGRRTVVNPNIPIRPLPRRRGGNFFYARPFLVLSRGGAAFLVHVAIVRIPLGAMVTSLGMFMVRGAGAGPPSVRR